MSDTPKRAIYENNDNVFGVFVIVSGIVLGGAAVYAAVIVWSERDLVSDLIDRVRALRAGRTQRA